MFAVLFFLCSIVLISGRAMWGLKKKSDSDEEPSKIAQNIIHTKSDKPRPPKKDFTRPRASVDSQASLKEWTNIISSSLKTLEELMDSNSLESLLSRESFQSILSKLSDIPIVNSDLKELLNLPDFNAFDSSQEQMRQVLSSFKSISDHFLSLMQDPSSLKLLLDQIPSPYSELLEALLAGRTDELKEFISQLSGKFSSILLP
jgi:hypothetical protein